MTFETLYEILRREKYRAELQRLEPDFLRRVEQYLGEKQAILAAQEKKDSMFADSEAEKTKLQIKNLQKMLRELYERREEKVMHLALFFSKTGELPDITVMLKGELEMFNEVKDMLKKYKKRVLKAIGGAEEEKPKALKTAEELRVKFMVKMQEFVGADLKSYGPFEASEVVLLPRVVADLLVKNKQAERQDEDTKEG